MLYARWTEEDKTAYADLTSFFLESVLSEHMFRTFISIDNFLIGLQLKPYLWAAKIINFKAATDCLYHNDCPNAINAKKLGEYGLVAFSYNVDKFSGIEAVLKITERILSMVDEKSEQPLHMSCIFMYLVYYATISGNLTR